MSLISVRYVRSSQEGVIYSVVDNDFGEVEIGIPVYSGYEVNYAFAVCEVYRARMLPVGKNLALGTIHFSKRWQKLYSIDELIALQNQYCPKVVPNWKQYSRERDEYLEKLLPLL